MKENVSVLVGKFDRVKLINIAGLSEEEIETQKKALVKKHISKLLKANVCSPLKDVAKEACKSRQFFVRLGDSIALCGVYAIHEKRDPIGDSRWIAHLTFDYVIYNESDGFFRVNGCSDPDLETDIKRCCSPAIYHQCNTSEQFSLLEYGSEYSAHCFKNVIIKHNVRSYLPNRSKLYEVNILHNMNLMLSDTGVTLYYELPLVSWYIVISKAETALGQSAHACLERIDGGKTIRLFGLVQNSVKYESKLRDIIIYADNPEMRISNSDSFFFYVSKNDTIASDAIMKCAAKFGSMELINSLLAYDSSQNYRIEISRTSCGNAISFIYGVISKSHAVYPTILGCPIHDIVEVLRDNYESLPKHYVDTTSARNAIKLIRDCYGSGLEDWEIIQLLIKNYGQYSVIDQFAKFWAYFHGAGLNCDRLPTEMESIVGERISGGFVKKLANNTWSAKWVSELTLYRLVLKYYQDSVFHYTDTWLDGQHLDIYIPSKNIAIEYQGAQHYQAIGFFGGEEAAAYRQLLDDKKRACCSLNDTLLIEWPYTLPITAANLICALLSGGITEIPIPDPEAVPVKYESNRPINEQLYVVCQYGLDGKLLNRFANYNEAARTIGITPGTIMKAATGYNNTAGGFQWRRLYADGVEESIPALERMNAIYSAKSVYQISKAGEVIAEFNSINEAERVTGIDRKSIRAVLNGKREYAGGYVWKEKC